MTEPVELGDYSWVQNGQEMTGRLSAADAERLGARPVDENGDATEDEGSSDKPASKARKPQSNK